MKRAKYPNASANTASAPALPPRLDTCGARHTLDHLLHLVRHPVPAECGCPGERAAPQTLPSLVLAEHANDRLGACRDVSMRNEEPRLVVANRVPQSWRVAGDHRRS